ncbi:alpha-N-arabinofuranosidase [Pelagovum pacificum]|uniref:non-reducing end alpha-L-arabinofuranosidase n=1 Tax=Pelagovum pacificum TaxID=2588711 RepID=A0A5C5GFB5_9RHOB|nr:alpha-N-arabinofuranosidase [Pelagovum pacificum]QQA43410.1 alpha-N-arabinofuranosidase [Pelagovum pacificum]TNY33452.1 alpha-N-arabinofuranosidase [Pelagovum pacificum]
MDARVTAHRRYTIADIDKRLYGSFLEHLGRAIYTGIYEPGHPTADGNGMRKDVIDLVREIDTPICRYPGGNFVSAYNWEDGIGPKEDRPTRLDLAWHTSESNEVGIHEFAEWAEAANTEMMLAVNLGSRGLDEARAFLEYVNHPGGSYWSDLRKKNGRADPWDVKVWCLGNEMDGPWQVGHKSAEEYGHLANETAKAMRAFDKNLELIVCGSSSAQMPTYPQWESTVLDATYDNVDFISLHMYFANHEKNTAEYLAIPERLDKYIGTVSGVIDYIKGKKRSKKDVKISFDEWNVWYHSNEQDKKILQGQSGWPHAPALLEDIYNFEDVLQVGCALNTFIRRADRVKIACIAQLVNVIAPIMTSEGGAAWRQTIYWPFMFASRYGRGTALQLDVDVPSYDADIASDVKYLDIAGTYDDDAGSMTFFAVNRHPTEALETSVSLEGFAAAKSVEHTLVKHDDLEAVNTEDNPDNVSPTEGSGAKLDGNKLSMTLPPYSYSMIRVKL